MKAFIRQLAKCDYKTQLAQFFALQPPLSHFNSLTNYCLLGLKLKVPIDEKVQSTFTSSFLHQQPSRLTIQSIIVANKLLRAEVNDKAAVLDRLVQLLDQECTLEELVNIFKFQHAHLKPVHSEIYQQKLDLYAPYRVAQLQNHKTEKGFLKYLRNLNILLHKVPDQQQSALLLHYLSTLQQFKDSTKLIRMLSLGMICFSKRFSIIEHCGQLLGYLSFVREWNNKDIIAILNMLVKVGYNFSGDNPWLELLISRVQFKGLTAYQQALLWRCAFYFKKMPLLTSKLQQLSLFRTGKVNLSGRPHWEKVLAIQVMKMLGLEVDSSELYNYLFKFHKRKDLATPQQSLEYFLNLHQIPFVNEAIIGPYLVDLYIPFFPHKLKLQAGLTPRSFSRRFTSVTELLSYVEKSQSDRSIFLDIDGPFHFLDQNQTHQKGKTILKRDYLRQHVKFVTLQGPWLDSWYQIVDMKLKQNMLLEQMNFRNS